MSLYHYTSAIGLKGIVESKSIWATDHRFLNDPSEFTHGWAIVFDALKRRKEELCTVSVSSWDTIELFCQHSERQGVFAFVGSLSSAGDLLSQWRGYGGGKGFSIRFNEDWLVQNADAQGFGVHPVVYDPGEQRRVANDCVTLLLALLSERDAQAHHDVIREWWRHALKVALCLKNESFKEERESRLLWIGLSWPPGVATRISASGLIPYMSCSLNKREVSITLHPQNIGIEEIIIGPALGDQQRSALDALMATNGMRTEISKSRIPFIAG